MTTFELRPSTSTLIIPIAEQLVWSDDAPHQGRVHSDLDPWLTTFGPAPDHAIDLVRFGTGAYLADQLSRRLTTFSRTIDLAVHVLDAVAWTDDVLADLADLMASLTGDTWRLTALPTDGVRMVPDPDREAPALTRVALLSGGLDSFAGAVLSSADPGVAYLGQWDQPGVKAAQNAIRSWFHRSDRRIEYVQVRHGVRDAKTKRDRTTRSRSFLFMTLGIALAAARQATTLEVPENGYTSLNPPLGPDRGGALSTRSTHPETFERVNHLLEVLGINVRAVNPHASLTKGELVHAAAMASPGDFAAGAAETLSCAKLNGNWLGGNSNHSCGLCFACMVRRASLHAAGVRDSAPYLADELTGEGAAKLMRNRVADLEAIDFAIERGIEDTDVMALGPFPDDFDIDAAVDLCRRALTELSEIRRGA
jgi:7-cyano-7-deazaguanine synthase in queuosine biosynthesis